MVAFGTLFVANDNLVEKFANNEKVNGVAHIPTKKLVEYFYNGGLGAVGYTDLSVYEQVQKKKEDIKIESEKINH